MEVCKVLFAFIRLYTNNLTIPVEYRFCTIRLILNNHCKTIVLGQITYDSNIMVTATSINSFIVCTIILRIQDNRIICSIVHTVAIVTGN